MNQLGTALLYLGRLYGISSLKLANVFYTETVKEGYTQTELDHLFQSGYP